MKLGEIQLTAVERGHEIKDGGTDQAEHGVAEVKRSPGGDEQEAQ